MKPIWLAGAAALLAVTLSACSSSAEPKTGTKPSGPPLVQPATATPSASASPSDTGSGAPVTIDPCALVTSDEASQLTGAHYGSGKEEQDSAVSRRCIYGAQTKDVYEVIVVQGSSVAEAKTVKDDLLAQASQKITLTPVSGLGDDAQAYRATLQGILGISALYVLNGTVGFALVDEVNGKSPPTTAALVAQAQTVISRLP